MQVAEKELPKIRKSTTVLLDNSFDPSKTIPLVFHFEPHLFDSSGARLKKSSLERSEVEGKDIYTIDGFFSENEQKEMREFSRTTSFSRDIFGSKQAIEKGEKPARAMNGKERWQFFAKPPPAIQEFFKLLSWFSLALDAEVTTLPWDLCHGTTSSPTIATNFLEEVTPESMELGKHEDYNTEEEGIAFGIPILYGNGYHPSRFINGAPGKPWLISALIYSTHENFRPEYGMGTLFYKKDGTPALKTACRDLRLVICEGDILHSIEQSYLPPHTATWRVSYVFKLAFNPKKETQSMKQQFGSLMKRDDLMYLV